MGGPEKERRLRLVNLDRHSRRVANDIHPLSTIRPLTIPLASAPTYLANEVVGESGRIDRLLRPSKRPKATPDAIGSGHPLDPFRA